MVHSSVVPRLVSEELPLESYDRDEIFRLVHEAERVVQPIALKSGGYYYPQGAYQVFVTPTGARIGIWAQDPDDLVLEDVVVDASMVGKIFKYNKAGKKVSVEIGDKLPRRLKDLGNANLERLRIFTAKTGYRAKKWLHEEMSKHQSAFRAFTLEQGMLIRETPHRWTSGGILYQLVPHHRSIEKGALSHFMHMRGTFTRAGDIDEDCGNKDEQRFDLIMTLAPGYGWRLGRNFEHLYNKSKLSGIFMRAASLRAPCVTLAEAEKLVAADFEKRSPLFIDGLDPYGFIWNGNHTNRSWKKSRLKNFLIRRKLSRRVLKLGPIIVTQAIWKKSRWRNRPIRKSFLYLVYGWNQLSWKEVFKTFCVMAVSAFTLGTVAHLLGYAVNPFVYAGKMTGRTLTKTGELINGYTKLRAMLLRERGVEGLYRQYAKEWNERQIWGAKLDVSKINFLRALDHDELNTDLSFDVRIRSALPENWAVQEYIFGVLQGPPGSRITPFRLGKYGGLRVDEPNGLTVEHIPERGACFARLDRSKLGNASLPDSVAEFFKKLPPETPYLKVMYNPERGGFKSFGMSESDYRENIDRIRGAAYPPPHRVSPSNEVRLVEPALEQEPGLLQGLFGKSAGSTVTEAVESSMEGVGDAITKLRL